MALTHTMTNEASRHLPFWEPGNKADKKFTEQELVRVYMEGRKDGLEFHEKALYETLDRNVIQSAKNTSRIVKTMTEFRFKPLGAYLKISTFGDLDVMIMVREEHLLHAEFLKVYDFASELEADIRTDTYNIHFSFLDIPEGMNPEKNLICDGYIFKYHG